MRIDSADQYRKLKDKLQDESIQSKRGRIPVPCMNTLLVRRDLVRANNYNPNSVPKDKMRLLRQSILDNGFCFPIVTIWDDADGRFVIIDGFHRYTMSDAEWLAMDYVPVVVLAHDVSKRMYATVQFNKARGVHQVDLDAEVIRSLIEQGNTEEEICEHLGIDLETVHRYKQLTGIADLFKNATWSPSWSVVEPEEEDVN